MSLLTLAIDTLRDPDAILDRADDDRYVHDVVPRLLALAVLGAGSFGAVVGSYRGGLQIAFAATKMPVLFILPLLVALPAVYTLFTATGGRVDPRRLALAGLVGATRSAILAAAAGPAVWLVYASWLDYHAAVMLLAATLVGVGLPGLVVLGRVVSAPTHRRWIAIGASLAVMGSVTAQTGWLLRPFVARPTAQVAFLRPIEADIGQALLETSASSVGLYGESWEVERRGLAAEGLRTRPQPLAADPLWTRGSPP